MAQVEDICPKLSISSDSSQNQASIRSCTRVLPERNCNHKCKNMLKYLAKFKFI